jgi:hypothetical protein
LFSITGSVSDFTNNILMGSYRAPLPGVVKREQDTVEVFLRPFNDKRYNQDLEALCERVNAAAPRLPDGRRLHFSAQVNEVVRPILDAQKRRVA